MSQACRFCAWSKKFPDLNFLKRSFTASENGLRGSPDARVRSVRAQIPAFPIEANPLERVKVDAFKTAGVDHVVGGVRSRTIESSNAAVAAEVVKRAVGAELIRRKISVPLDEAEVIRGDHVVEIALSPTDGAVTLADTGELGSSLKTDASAMA